MMSREGVEMVLGLGERFCVSNPLSRPSDAKWQRLGARSAFAFFVAKANEVTDAGEARVVAECGDSRKRIPH